MWKKNSKCNWLVFTWDFLVWVLFLFPVLTGGIWYRRPGLKLELTETQVPVFLVSLLAAILIWKFQLPLQETTSVRFLVLLWNRWEQKVFNRPKQALGFGFAFVSCLSITVALLRHWSFGSGAADLGIFTNAIWNLTHGYGYVSSVKGGMNLFADHQSPLFWLFAPLFSIFPYAETLLISQSICLASTGVILYFLARQYLPKNHWGIAAVPILYWAYLPMRNANSFDFHPEVLMLPLFLAAITGMQSQRKLAQWGGCLSFILALAGKESGGPVAVGIGMAWLLGASPENVRIRTRRLGVIAIGLGFGVFYFDTQVVPKLLGTNYFYEGFYQQFGKGLSSLILAPIFKPVLFWTQVLGPSRIKFLVGTLAPLAFLPLLNWRTCIAALPGYLILFLCTGDHRVNLIYHYATEPGVALFWALPGAILKLQNLKFKPRWVLFWIVFWPLAFFGRSEIYRLRNVIPNEHQSWLRTQVFPCLSSASISASGSMVPHLANRQWAHHLPVFQTNTAWVDCIIFDPSVNNWPITTEAFNNLDQIVKAQGYEEKYSCGAVRIYQSKNSAEACLKCAPECH